MPILKQAGIKVLSILVVAAAGIFQETLDK